MRLLVNAAEQSQSVRRQHFPNVTTVRQEGRGTGDEPRDEFPPESLPGRYQYLGPIGSGGMGAVCSVRDLDLLRCVAMKVLGKNAGKNPENVRRFVREAQITAELDHPNIVPVYERGQDRHGNHYFTMKRVDGQTLAEWIETVGQPMKTPEAMRQMLAAVIKVCDGLAFAHNRGVLHCDVKPENIMVGSFGQAYLMDWGVACSLDERPKAAWLPVQIPARDDPAMPLFRGGLNGTPAFMAPEQAFGYTHLVDERTDVFGLGAVLYTILVGRPPFSGSEINAVISEARASAVTFGDVGAEACEPLPAELCRIAARAMARERHSRYQSVLDLQRALQAATDAAT